MPVLEIFLHPKTSFLKENLKKLYEASMFTFPVFTPPLVFVSLFSFSVFVNSLLSLQLGSYLEKSKLPAAVRVTLPLQDSEVSDGFGWLSVSELGLLASGTLDLLLVSGTGWLDESVEGLLDICPAGASEFCLAEQM